MRRAGPALPDNGEAPDSRGAHVWMHLCGDITAILPDLIDIGLNVLNPVQPQAMDVPEPGSTKYGLSAIAPFCLPFPIDGAIFSSLEIVWRSKVRHFTFGLMILVVAAFAVGAGGTGEAAPEQEPLRVGMDLRYPPFETQDASGVPFGISVDVAKAFGEYLGRPVEIVDTNFASLIPALNAGEIDVIIASMSRTAERQQAIDFTEPYFYFKIISLVNREFAEANGITIDSPKEALTALSQTRFTGITGQVSASIPQSLGFGVEIATNLEASVLNVVQGSSDVLMMSAFPVTRGYLANPEDTIVLWDPFVSSPIAMGVRKGEAELLAQANAFIAAMSQSGGVYDALRARWDGEVQTLLGRYGLEFFVNEN